MGNGAERAKLPVAALAGEAYRSVFGRLPLLLDRAWPWLIPALAAALLPGLYFYYLPLASSGWEIVSGFTWLHVINAVVELVALNAFAVRWYGATLFAPPRVEPEGILRAALPRFVLYSLPFYLALVIAQVVQIPFADAVEGVEDVVLPSAGEAIRAVAVTFAALATGLLTLHCALVFPAAAYGAPLALGEAWRRMRGNTWRLAACCLIAFVPLSLGVGMLLRAVLTTAGFRSVRLAEATAPLGISILLPVVGTIADFLQTALIAAILSETYRALVIRDRRE